MYILNDFHVLNFQNKLPPSTVFQKLGNVSELLSVNMADVFLSSNHTHVWSFSGLNVNISQCELDFLEVAINKLLAADQPQIIIHDSSFQSLNLQTGTAAIINDCYMDANNSKTSTLIKVNNSNVFITNSVFKHFMNENGPSVLHGESDCNIKISRSEFTRTQCYSRRPGSGQRMFSDYK